MKRFFGSSVVLSLALAASLAAAASAQAPAPAAPADAATPAAKASKSTKVTKTTTTKTTTTTTATKPAVGGVRGSFLFQIDQAQDKLLQLANAVPAEKYAWKPGEGVRSVGEVFNHVAAANYFFPTIWKSTVAMPAGVDPRTFEKEMSGDKAKTIDTLTKSFEHVRAAIAAASEADLNAKTNIFGHDATVRDAMLIVVTHAHEHLGQAIAYARSNGIVPPWSAKGD
jgi:uncharacterized damage-inducible protein DinB